MILDGGLGLELERRGFVYSTRLWSGEAVLAAPDMLRGIHRAYLDAGADVIETATYQLSHATLRELGYDAAASDEVFVRAVRIAREAIAEYRAAGVRTAHPQLVAGSLGPYGATLGDGSEYTGVQHLKRAALYAFHADRTRALVAADPDFVLFETIPTRAEALVIANVARDLGLTGVWISLACADGALTYGGDRVDDIVSELAVFDCVRVIGVNCAPPAAVTPLVRAIQSVTGKEILVYPNLGQRWDGGTHGLAGGDPADELLSRVGEWLELGVAHIGGCCGVGPETIAALARLAASADPFVPTR